jgi:hypothetical protein
VFIPSELDSVAPHFVLPLPPSTPFPDSYRPCVVAPTPWLQSQLEQLTFDFIIRDTLPYDHLRSCRYRLKVIEQEDDIQLDSQSDFNFKFSPEYKYFTKAEMHYLSEYIPGTMFALTSSFRVIHFTYVEAPSASLARAGQRQAVLMYEIPVGPEKFVDLRAASGRSVYQVYEDETARAIHVADYHSFRCFP